MVNYDVSLINQFIGMLIISIIFFLLFFGVLFTYFSFKSTKIHGIILIGVAMILIVVLYIAGKLSLASGRTIPWWNIFKIEGFFADLGALLGIMAVLGIIMVIIIQTDRVK